jgi:hypothetical protein
MFDRVYDDNPVHQIKPNEELAKYLGKSFDEIKNLPYYDAEFNNDVVSRLKLLSKWQRRKVIRKQLEEVHWPYKDFKKYLENRLPYLSELVVWGDEEEKSRSEDKDINKDKDKDKDKDENRIEGRIRRSKIVMNVIKDAIHFHFYEKYATIARNEAHIRLMSSTWYMCKNLMRITLISAILSLLAIAYPMVLKTDLLLPLQRIIFVASFWLYIISYLIFRWIKWSIECSLHYQRIREIVFILNTAFQARKIDPFFCSEIWGPELSFLRFS